MEKYLTLFTIGPVQSFIAKARKLQDLYAGSFLLSHLSKSTMLKAREKGAEILFPNLEQGSAPNRFLMKIECEDKTALRSFCAKLEKYVRCIWENIAKDVLKAVRLDYSEAVEKQITSMLQVYYASEPYKNGEEFGESYVKTIERLGSAKMLRNFEQLDEGYGRKCDLMYEYNALFYREKRNYLAEEAQIVNDENRYENKLDKYIQNGETLSAPAFVKRCLKFAILEFNDSFPAIEDVYEMYYDRKFNADDGRHGYYAVVMFDGDDMGMWYSEPDKDKGVKKELVEEFQTYLSKKISNFAAEKSQIIVDWKNRKNGVVIYAGGEDFLGALNIEKMFSALKELRETFGEIDIKKYTDKKLTFSAGVVLAHVKTPLSEVLKMAREAEKKAKANPGKDAYCLTIAKRSGEVTEFVKPFYYDKECGKCRKSTLVDLDRLVEIIVEEKLSTKFIYQLGIELERIVETDDIKEMFLIEAKRIIQNSDFLKEDNDKKKKEENDKRKKEIVDEICKIFEQMMEISSIKNLLSYLRAVAFIVRERGVV
ncbi:MAG: type III-B CRISPR-associated protein Cas10/Cmr2 [Treponema sp.]|nr:type III-B CRISPR-associated protein Cas10/Cmr2 [Treponema sp.]